MQTCKIVMAFHACLMEGREYEQDPKLWNQIMRLDEKEAAQNSTRAQQGYSSFSQAKG